MAGDLEGVESLMLRIQQLEVEKTERKELVGKAISVIRPVCHDDNLRMAASGMMGRSFCTKASTILKELELHVM